ncbi:LPP20 family lipoprotein [Helicobacter sp. MIT 99-5507]|uniref:LPP20 family lipoprotein n=1 Tax=Helicobacter sp. MIT 99-5507 TaxID=152489 RepID=UPI000E1F347D|nr:LPP20 family lipoprotein [Helicobacter sp. MIT 99-5507]RDU57317.1 hypothetical protein CQA42_05055 [Helicobacter sp. MIT 99-5507]
MNLIKALVFFSFFIISCSSVTQYPSWYLSTNKDSSYLYGVGSSNNLQDAKFEALNDIASQISLSIESDINISKEQKNENLSNVINSNIGVNVGDIELDSLEYPLVEEIDKVFFVQARIKKDIIISKLNSNINFYVTDINNILNSIKSSMCRTLSPKHKHNLSLFMSKIDLYSKQIKALGGVVSNQALIDSVNQVLQNQPTAYYASFVQGGKGDDYSLIEASLLNEYNKFFDIQSKDSKIYYIENRYNITRTISSVGIKFYSNIKDCSNNIIFSTSIDVDSKDINLAIDRFKAQLYKKIQTWVES